MNIEKWEADDIPLEILALKLCEEAGEVGNILTDLLIVEDGEYGGHRALSKKDRQHIQEELDHVIDIAKILKGRC